MAYQELSQGVKRVLKLKKVQKKSKNKFNAVKKLKTILEKFWDSKIIPRSNYSKVSELEKILEKNLNSGKIRIYWTTFWVKTEGEGKELALINHSPYANVGQLYKSAKILT